MSFDKHKKAILAALRAGHALRKGKGRKAPRFNATGAWRDIQGAAAGFSVKDHRGSNAEQQRAKLDRLQDRVRSLRTSLDEVANDPALYQHLSYGSTDPDEEFFEPDGDSTFSAVQRHIELLDEWLAAARSVRKPKAKKSTALDAIIWALARVYNAHTGSRPGLVRDWYDDYGRNANGPFLDFVWAFARGVGTEATEKQIENAIRRAQRDGEWFHVADPIRDPAEIFAKSL